MEIGESIAETVKFSKYSIQNFSHHFMVHTVKRHFENSQSLS